MPINNILMLLSYRWGPSCSNVMLRRHGSSRGLTCVTCVISSGTPRRGVTSCSIGVIRFRRDPMGTRTTKTPEREGSHSIHGEKSPVYVMCKTPLQGIVRRNPRKENASTSSEETPPICYRILEHHQYVIHL